MLKLQCPLCLNPGTFFANLLFLTTTAPPSPKVVIFFCAWKEKHAKSPIVPTFFPFISAPKAWAQSSTIIIFLFFNFDFNFLTSNAYPYKWTITITFVFFVIFFKISLTDIVLVCKSISHQINFPPFLAKGIAEAQYVCAGTIISSFFLIPQSNEIISRGW